jgi:hypothetical protein
VVARTRLANGDWPDVGRDLALRKIAVAHDPLLARLSLQIGMLGEKLSNLRVRPAGSAAHARRFAGSLSGNR